MPVAMSATIESVTLAANFVHLLAPHVRYSSEEPHAELSSPILATAPRQDVSGTGVRDVVSPHALNVERNILVNVSAVLMDLYEA